MNATPRSFRNVLLIAASCSLVVPFEIARAQQPTPQPQANAAVEPPKPPAAATPVPVPQPKASLPVQRVHPQVSQSSLLREYRSLSMASTHANETRIQEALDDEVPQGTWKFDETPLRDVVAQVRESLKVPVDLDRRALEDAGLDPETLVIFQAQGGTVRSALRRLLDDLDLTSIIRDECLLITTKEKAAEQPVVRLYPLPFGFASDTGVLDLAPLIDLIQNTVGPATWNTVGGQGSIQESRELRAIVVSQTMEIHDELEGLMRSLHARGLAELGVAADGSDPRAPIVRIHAVPDARVRADLAAKLVDLCNASLAKGADEAARVTDIGDCLAVQSVSPEFQILAGQLIRGVAGVTVSVRDSAFRGVGGGMGGGVGMTGAAGVGGGSF